MGLAILTASKSKIDKDEKKLTKYFYYYPQMCNYVYLVIPIMLVKP
jgi:hypothetical protein